MGIIRAYPPVKFFTAITFNSQAELEDILIKLEDVFSPIENKSSRFQFDKFTTYYQPEMGYPLQKLIISFTRLLSAEELPALKIATNEIEKIYLKNKKRMVNIDPGYVCAAKMVLATTKDYDHRIYLGRGIFGDIHYRFRKGRFQFNEWTYPDYQQEEIRLYFENLRNTYLDQLKTWSIE